MVVYSFNWYKSDKMTLSSRDSSFSTPTKSYNRPRRFFGFITNKLKHYFYFKVKTLIPIV